jgi:hypothetical protein
MLVPRRALVALAAIWVLVALYPDPGTLVSSVRNLLSPEGDPAAAQALAATMPDDPREIERRVLSEVVPYATDWEAEGVPWVFPTAAEALRARRGDCESRALVLASVLAAKGIPHEIRMSLDHIWVDYPGKVPTANENEGRVLAGKDERGWSWPRWPDDLDLGRELRAQAAIYWDPMPPARKGVLFVGLAGIALWNVLAAAFSRPAWGRAAAWGMEVPGSPTPSSAGGPS